MHKILTLTTNDLILLQLAMMHSLADGSAPDPAALEDVRAALTAYQAALPCGMYPLHDMQPRMPSPQVVSPMDFTQQRWKAEGRI